MSVRGRPRDPGLDARIRAAAIDLLLERGLAGMTVDDIAERAGVGKAAVYRRYSSKEELALEAADRLIKTEIPIPKTGDLSRDIEQALGDLLSFVRTERGAALLRVLAAEALRRPEFARLQRTLWERRREQAQQTLGLGCKRRQLRDGIDLDLVLDIVLGVVAVRMATGRPLLDARESAQLIELLLHGIARPASEAPVSGGKG